MSKIVSMSEAASIAIHGIVLVARSAEPVNVVQIAEATGASRHHVAKIMQRLAKNGYLSSLRGPAGGFSMKANPSEISLLEVFEAIEGKIEITKCPLDKPICPFEKCLMDNVTNKMTTEFREYMGKQTLAKYL
jgi:Rrf2 family protein